MQGKKRYLALILFFVIGLVGITFANPSEELEPVESNVKKVADTKPEKETEKAVKKAELKPSTEAVEEAEEIIEESVTLNPIVRQELTERLEIVEEAIDASELVSTVERMVEESENKNDIIASEYYFNNNNIERITGEMEPGDVRDNLEDRINTLIEIFEDESAPEIKGITNGEKTNKNVKITISDTNETTTTVMLNDKKIDFAEEFTEEGVYTINVLDAAQNLASITFTIDKKAPKFEGLASREVDIEYYKIDVTDTTDVVITLQKDFGKWVEVEEGYELIEEGTYQLKAVDAANNPYTTWIHIDKTAPTITVTPEGELINVCPTIEVFDRYLDKVTIDGKVYDRKSNVFTKNNQNENFKLNITLEDCEDGLHTITAVDKRGLPTTKEFTVDTTVPKITTINIRGGKAFGAGAKTTYYAKKGSIIYLNVFFKEELHKKPVFVLNGTKTIQANGPKYDPKSDTYNYYASWTLTDELQDGLIQVEVKDFSDKAGNTTTYKLEDHKLESQSRVIVDNSIPKITTINIRGGKTVGKGAKTTYYAKKGTIIYLNVYFKEELYKKPVFVLNGTKTIKASGPKHDPKTNTYNYYASWTLTDELEDGLINVEVKDFSDNVGNTTTYKLEDHKFESQSRCIVDNIAPTVSLLGDENIILAMGEIYNESGVKVIDNIDGESTLTSPKTIELYNTNDQLIGTVDTIDTAMAGKYVLTYQTTDNAGNVSNIIQRTVSIYANVIRTADDLKELFSSFDNIKNKIVILQSDIDMSGVSDWKPIMGVDTYEFVLEGNNHKISNLTYETTNKNAGLLFEGMDSGDVTINNLTIENCKVTSTNSDSYVGLIGGYIDSINSININNVHIINSEINSTNYAGAFLGWTAGYNTQNDGPVDGIVNITNCSVKGTKVIGGGSAGLATGHAGSNPGTYTTIKNFIAEDNVIKGERVDKTGAIIGTANSGEVVLENITYNNNTVFDVTNSAKLVGRFVPNSTGKLTHIVDDEKEYIDAIANALSGQVIKLGKDLDFMDQTTTIAKDKSIILDLNGKTIDGKSTKGETSSLFTVKNNASLTIKGDGIITYEAGKPDTDWGGEGQREFPGYANNTIRNEGKLVIDGVSIFNTTPSGGATFVIDNYPGADLIVEDGIVQQVGGATAIRMFANSTTLNTKVTINGGKISGAAAVWLQLPSSNSASAPKAELVINGGTFSSVKSSDAVYSYSYGNSHANTSITITGGTFNHGVQFGYNATNFYDDFKTLSITGGTFNSYLGKWTTNHEWINIEVPTNN